MWGITANLGRPERAVIFMPQFSNLRSMLDWDFTVIFTYLTLNAIAYVYTIHKYRNHADVARKFIVPFMIISTPFAIGIHTVTAWIFHALTARPALNTALLAPRFIATAFASGPALLLLVVYILEKTTGWFRVSMNVYRKTLNVIVVALATGLFFTLAELHEVFWYTSEPIKREQFALTFFGGPNTLLNTLTWMWVTMGLAAALLGMIPSVRRSKTAIAYVALVTFIAVFAEKTLATILPGFIVNPVNMIAHYEIVPIELFVGVGIHATLFILFAILIRAYLVTLKAKEGVKA